jgi:hypothetical protein
VVSELFLGPKNMQFVFHFPGFQRNEKKRVAFGVKFVKTNGIFDFLSEKITDLKKIVSMGVW